MHRRICVQCAPGLTTETGSFDVTVWCQIFCGGKRAEAVGSLYARSATARNSGSEYSDYRLCRPIIFSFLVHLSLHPSLTIIDKETGTKTDPKYWNRPGWKGDRQHTRHTNHGNIRTADLKAVTKRRDNMLYAMYFGFSKIKVSAYCVRWLSSEYIA